MTPTELTEGRKALSLTQQQLADALGVYQQTVARWERGKREIPPYLHLAIRALGQERALLEAERDRRDA